MCPYCVSSHWRSLHAKIQPMRSWHSWACLVLWMVTMEACPNIPSDRRDISFWHEEASNWWPRGTLTWISFCSAEVEESEEGNCLMPFDAIYIKYAWKARKLRSQHGTTSSKSCEQRAESLDDVVSNLQKTQLACNASCSCCWRNIICSGSTWNFPISEP